MMILCQNRENIFSAPSRMYVRNISGRGYIFCNSNDYPIMGDYRSPQRAIQVLQDITTALKEDRKYYEMPGV